VVNWRFLFLKVFMKTSRRLMLGAITSLPFGLVGCASSAEPDQGRIGRPRTISQSNFRLNEVSVEWSYPRNFEMKLQYQASIRSTQAERDEVANRYSPLIHNFVKSFERQAPIEVANALRARGVNVAPAFAAQTVRLTPIDAKLNLDDGNSMRILVQAIEIQSGKNWEHVVNVNTAELKWNIVRHDFSKTPNYTTVVSKFTETALATMTKASLI
jgi:hypothetical protein